MYKLTDARKFRLSRTAPSRLAIFKVGFEVNVRIAPARTDLDDDWTAELQSNPCGAMCAMAHTLMLEFALFRQKKAGFAPRLQPLSKDAELFLAPYRLFMHCVPIGRPC